MGELPFDSGVNLKESRMTFWEPEPLLSGTSAVGVISSTCGTASGAGLALGFGRAELTALTNDLTGPP